MSRRVVIALAALLQVGFLVLAHLPWGEGC